LNQGKPAASDKSGRETAALLMTGCPNRLRQLSDACVTELAAPASGLYNCYGGDDRGAAGREKVLTSEGEFQAHPGGTPDSRHSGRLPVPVPPDISCVNRTELSLSRKRTLAATGTTADRQYTGGRSCLKVQQHIDIL
jgi:hypothetical protein